MRLFFSINVKIFSRMFGSSLTTLITKLFSVIIWRCAKSSLHSTSGSCSKIYQFLIKYAGHLPAVPLVAAPKSAFFLIVQDSVVSGCCFSHNDCRNPLFRQIHNQSVAILRCHQQTSSGSNLIRIDVKKVHRFLRFPAGSVFFSMLCQVRRQRLLPAPISAPKTASM